MLPFIYLKSEDVKDTRVDMKTLYDAALLLRKACAPL